MTAIDSAEKIDNIFKG